MFFLYGHPVTVISWFQQGFWNIMLVYVMTNQCWLWRKCSVGPFFFPCLILSSNLLNFLLRTPLVIIICFLLLGSVQPWISAVDHLKTEKEARAKGYKYLLMWIRSWGFYKPHYKHIPECFQFINACFWLTLWGFHIKI